MKIYPIHVPRHSYRGSNPAKQRRASEYNADALQLERYLNAQINANPEPIQQFIYGFMVPRVGMTEDRIRKILYSVDCGHNGLTVAKSEQAWRDFLEARPSGPLGPPSRTTTAR